MKFEIFFLTALLLIPIQNHKATYVDDSITYFNDLETLKKMVINKSFMECFFLQQSKFQLTSDCDKNKKLSSKEKNYSNLMAKILTDILFKEKSCFKPNEKSFKDCKNVCMERFRDFLPITLNSHFDQKSLNIIINIFASYFIFLDKKKIQVNKKFIKPKTTFSDSFFIPEIKNGTKVTYQNKTPSLLPELGTSIKHHYKEINQNHYGNHKVINNVTYNYFVDPNKLKSKNQKPLFDLEKANDYIQQKEFFNNSFQNESELIPENLNFSQMIKNSNIIQSQDQNHNNLNEASKNNHHLKDINEEAVEDKKLEETINENKSDLEEDKSSEEEESKQTTSTNVSKKSKDKEKITTDSEKTTSTDNAKAEKNSKPKTVKKDDNPKAKIIKEEEKLKIETNSKEDKPKAKIIKQEQKLKIENNSNEDKSKAKISVEEQGLKITTQSNEEKQNNSQDEKFHSPISNEDNEVIKKVNPNDVDNSSNTEEDDGRTTKSREEAARQIEIQKNLLILEKEAKLINVEHIAEDSSKEEEIEEIEDNENPLFNNYLKDKLEKEKKDLVLISVNLEDLEKSEKDLIKLKNLEKQNEEEVNNTKQYIEEFDKSLEGKIELDKQEEKVLNSDLEEFSKRDIKDDLDRKKKEMDSEINKEKDDLSKKQNELETNNKQIEKIENEIEDKVRESEKNSLNKKNERELTNIILKTNSEERKLKIKEEKVQNYQAELMKIKNPNRILFRENLEKDLKKLLTNIKFGKIKLKLDKIKLNKKLLKFKKNKMIFSLLNSERKLTQLNDSGNESENNTLKIQKLNKEIQETKEYLQKAEENKNKIQNIINNYHSLNDDVMKLNQQRNQEIHNYDNILKVIQDKKKDLEKREKDTELEMYKNKEFLELTQEEENLEKEIKEINLRQDNLELKSIMLKEKTQKQNDIIQKKIEFYKKEISALEKSIQNKENEIKNNKTNEEKEETSNSIFIITFDKLFFMGIFFLF